MPSNPPVQKLPRERPPCASTPSPTAYVPVTSSPQRRLRGIQASLGRSRSRVATPEPHRADASGTDVHLPMVARAVYQKRESHLSVRNVNRETVRLTRPRFHATCPPGALLHERHAGIEAVTKGAAGSAQAAAGAASANRASRKTSGSAPRLCDVGGQGPSSLLFPRHPRYPLECSRRVAESFPPWPRPAPQPDLSCWTARAGGWTRCSLAAPPRPR